MFWFQKELSLCNFVEFFLFFFNKTNKITLTYLVHWTKTDRVPSVQLKINFKNHNRIIIVFFIVIICLCAGVE